MDEKEEPEKTTVIPHSIDGDMVITYTEQEFHARADFIPHFGGGKPLTRERVIEILRQNNINHGIIWENIDDSLKTLNTFLRPVRTVQIAKGETPSTGESAYYKFEEGLEQTKLPGNKNVNVDYKAVSSFTLVSKGQVLAKLIPEIEGKDGWNVHGTAIPHEIIHHPTVTGGSNTVTSETTITSAINGKLISAQDTVSVDEVLVIKGQVGYGTGHINFPGDVVIDGPVADGFKLHAGGSILIKQTLDVTEMNVKKDLIVNGGIIGRKTALIKVGGCIKAKFINNCHIACRGSMSIDSEIVSSSVFCLDVVTLGEKGRMMGSEIHAVNGVKAGIIGTKSGKAVQIYCGADFTVKQEINKYNIKLRFLAAKLQKLIDLIIITKEGTPQRTKMDELSRRLEDEIDKVTACLTELNKKVNKNEKAVVEASIEIAPRTFIDICGITFQAETSLKRARLRLNRNKGKLAQEPLNEPMK